MQVSGNKVHIEFDHVGGGLVARDGKPLSFFTIAGEDKKFVPATAVIEDVVFLKPTGRRHVLQRRQFFVEETKTVVTVSGEGVSKPVAVRMGWHEEAEPNLSNKEGLPASPFRTDDWK